MENSAPYLQLQTDRRHHLLELHWQGFVPSEVYRAGMLEAIHVSGREKTNTWVMDMKAMKVIRQADQDWTLITWFAQFNLLSIRRLAFVISDDIFNQMAVSSMVATMRPKMQAEVEYFETIAAAVQWAKEVNRHSSDSGLFSVK
jgi:hypothetical protein